MHLINPHDGFVMELTVEEFRSLATKVKRTVEQGVDSEQQSLAACLEEYKFLRTEIEAIWSQTYTSLNFILVLVGVVVAAVFSKEIDKPDRVAVLLGASVVTFGGYYIIYVHTGRIWRITTYMRRALEPRLKGIAWETRLAARHDALSRAKATNPIDRSLFDAHMFTLHVVNGMLTLLLLWTLLPRLGMLSELFPSSIISWVNWIQGLSFMPQLAALCWLMLVFVPVIIAILAWLNFNVTRGAPLERANMMSGEDRVLRPEYQFIERHLMEKIPKNQFNGHRDSWRLLTGCEFQPLAVNCRASNGSDRYSASEKKG